MRVVRLLSSGRYKFGIDTPSRFMRHILMGDHVDFVSAVFSLSCPLTVTKGLPRSNAVLGKDPAVEAGIGML